MHTFPSPRPFTANPSPGPKGSTPQVYPGSCLPSISAATCPVSARLGPLMGLLVPASASVPAHRLDDGKGGKPGVAGSCQIRGPPEEGWGPGAGVAVRTREGREEKGGGARPQPRRPHQARPVPRLCRAGVPAWRSGRDHPILQQNQPFKTRPFFRVAAGELEHRALQDKGDK